VKKTLVLKSMITLICVLIFHTQLYGQPEEHRSIPPPDCPERLQKDLNLTEAQMEKVKSIFNDQKNEMDAMMKASDDERRTRHESMMKKRKETDERIIALLNEKQKEKFAEMQKKHEEISDEHQRGDRPRLHERHHMSRESRPPMLGPMFSEEHIAMLKDALTLTDSQIAKVKAIFSEQEKEMQQHQDLRQDDPRAKDERMMEKRKEIDGKITAILSAEQKQKYEELIKKECEMLRDQHKPFEGGK
jgi:Spy/CpxP family protein refolding chaperone